MRIREQPAEILLQWATDQTLERERSSLWGLPGNTSNTSKVHAKRHGGYYTCTMYKYM